MESDSLNLDVHLPTDAVEQPPYPFQDDTDISDVIIEVEGRRLYLHSLVLNKISSEFKDMILKNRDEEKVLRIDLSKEIKFSAMIDMFKFYYPIHNFDVKTLLRPIGITSK